MPVRAVPFVTGHAFSPRTIAAAIGDDREEAAARVFETWLHPASLDEHGGMRPTEYGALKPCVAMAAAAFSQEAPLADQIAALPSGVFISKADLASIVKEINSLCHGESAFGDGRVPIGINANPLVPRRVATLFSRPSTN